MVSQDKNLTGPHDELWQACEEEGATCMSEVDEEAIADLNPIPDCTRYPQLLYIQEVGCASKKVVGDMPQLSYQDQLE